MKIVFDTNVLISALLWNGLPHKLLIMVEEGDLTLCTTPLLLEELRDVLNRSFFSPFIIKRNTSSEEILAALCEIVELYSDKSIDPVVKDDPDDDIVLSCALVSGAKYIITGDNHLLKLKKWIDISILTPQQFLKHIRPY